MGIKLNSMEIKKTFIVLGILSLILGIFCGFLGYTVSGFLTSYKVINREKASVDLAELARQKGFLGTQQGLDIKRIFDAAQSVVVGIYKKNKPSAEEFSEYILYNDNDYMGGGIILTSDGWVATHASVVQGIENDSFVIAHANIAYEIEQIIADPFSSLVFLKILAIQLPVEKFSNSNQFEVGQSVLSINSLTGVWVRRIARTDFRFFEGGAYEFSDKLSQFLVLDGTYDRNFSGAPAFTQEGEILGLHFSLNKQNNYNIVIPSGHIKKALEGILALNRIHRPSLGLRYIDLSKSSEYRRDLSQETQRGLYVVMEPQKNTPAKLAGIQKGDIIIAYDTNAVPQEKSFGNIIQEYDVGEKITLTIVRGKQSLELPIFLGILEDSKNNSFRR